MSSSGTFSTTTSPTVPLPHAAFSRTSSNLLSAIHTADVSRGAPYATAVPCAAADSLVLWVLQQTTFVDHLRIAFPHGGFLGLDINDNSRPRPFPKR